MDKDDLKLIIAQQVVILKRLEKLEKEVNGRSRSFSNQYYADDLKKEALKIIDQIEVE